MPKSSREKNNGRRIRLRLSKIRFPEVCPVCLDMAEDLVFVTVTLRAAPDSYESTSMTRKRDKASVAIEAARGSVTFSVPTCLLHGSKSVRSLRTKFIAVFGFFILFYPILFFLLQLNAALVYSRSVTEPLFGLLVFIMALLTTSAYGLFPRALERALRFENISKIKDSVDVIISRSDYLKKLIEMNEMFVEYARDDDAQRV